MLASSQAIAPKDEGPFWARMGMNLDEIKQGLPKREKFQLEDVFLYSEYAPLQWRYLIADTFL